MRAFFVSVSLSHQGWRVSQARFISALVVGGGQKYLRLLEAKESGKILSNQIADGLKLAAHLVGCATRGHCDILGDWGYILPMTLQYTALTLHT